MSFGHIFAGLLLKLKPKKLSIMPFGLAVTFESYEYKKLVENKKIVIAFAGPLTNILISIVLLFIQMDQNLKQIMIYSNILVAVFNLIPIYPLDGGQILNRVLRIIYGNFEAYKISNSVNNIIMSILTALASIGLLCTKNIAIIFIIIFLWYLIIKENKKYKEICKYFKSFHKLDKKSNYNI